MKITYEFDTDSENFDPTEYKQVTQAKELALALWRIDNHLRNSEKYGDDAKVLPSDVRAVFHDILEDLNINMRDLIS